MQSSCMQSFRSRSLNLATQAQNRSHSMQKNKEGEEDGGGEEEDGGREEEEDLEPHNRNRNSPHPTSPEPQQQVRPRSFFKALRKRCRWSRGEGGECHG